MKYKWILTGTALALSAALAGCGKTQSSQTQAQMISMEAAQTAALQAANIDAANAAISSSTLSEVAGVTCYKVEFTSSNHVYTYSINAKSGEVLEASYRYKDAAPTGSAHTSPNASNGTVDEAKAQELALAHAGVNAADATITKSKLVDYDDGRQIYEIEWYMNDAKYEYEISVASGEVIKSDYEAKTVVGIGNSATVSEAMAKQTAIARVSGADEKDIYEWKLDYDDGHPEYEGKIIYSDTEYEFTIDAASGNITEWESEALHR